MGRRQAACLIIRAKNLPFRANRTDSGLAGSGKRLYSRGNAAIMRLRNRVDAETQGWSAVETSVRRIRQALEAAGMSSSCRIADGPGVRLWQR